MEEHMESLEDVPTINLSLLRHNPLSRSSIIKKIREACRTYGFFNVINHGVPDSIIDDALNVNAKFFEIPKAEKEELISEDIYKVVRLQHVQLGDYSRDFLKLFAHPLHQFLHLWPTSPPNYREKMAVYSTEARKLCIELFEAITESLKLNQTTHLKQKFEQGIQIVGINCYNPCSGSSMKSGVPPHTDHSIITLVVQSDCGFQVIDRVGGGSWKNVPRLKGSLQVVVGDHLEVISNGLYKSVKHRAISSCTNMRLSIANFHSLALDEIVEPAELESEENSRKYRGSSLGDYLKHLASGDKRAHIDTLKIDGEDS